MEKSLIDMELDKREKAKREHDHKRRDSWTKKFKHVAMKSTPRRKKKSRIVSSSPVRALFR